MARSPDSLEDPTPLESDSLDVRRRVGWLLRTTRLHCGAGPTTATAFARTLGVPAAAVSKWEKGASDPSAAALEGYERSLGLPPAVLRALVAGLRREFDQPVRRPAAPSTAEAAEADEQARTTLAGPVTGAEWMTFATTLTAGATRALPDVPARPALDRLVSETVRAVDGAYLTRMEALALLRTGPYHDVVREACLDFALEPSTQVSADVLGALGVKPEKALLDTMCRLLTHDDDSVFVGACHAIVTMRRSRPALSAHDLRSAAPRIAEAYAACVVDPMRHAALSAVLRELPQGFRKLVAAQRLPDLAPPPLAGSGDSREEAWALAGSIAVEVMHRLDARPEPLLTRTTYEALTESLSLRSAWARCLLMTLPYRDVLGEVLVEECRRADPAHQRAMAPLLCHLGRPGVALAGEWVEQPAVDLQRGGLRTLAHHAEGIETTRARALLSSEDAAVRRLAGYAAGMTGSSVLKEWAVDATLPAEARVAADWWLRHGSRVDDEGPSAEPPTS